MFEAEANCENVLGQKRQTGGVQCIQGRSEEDWMGGYRGFKV